MKYLLLTVIVSFFSSFGFTQAPVDGLIAFYPFNGSAIDASGNNYNGTVNGATLTSDRYGNVNSAYNFDGIDDWINTTYQQSNLTAFTVSAWVKTSMYGGNNSYSIIQNRGPNVPGGMSMTLDYWKDINQWRFGADGYNIGIYQSVFMQNDNQWMHITGTWQSTGSSIDAGQMKLYINGKLIVNTPTNNGAAVGPVNGTGTMKIAFHEAFNTYFDGAIDEIRIYNRELCEYEVSQLYLTEAPIANLTNGLELHYPMDGNAIDISGNSRNGILHGVSSTIDRFGNPNSALLFDGIDDWIETPYIENPTNGFAVSVWVKADYPITNTGAGPAAIIQNRGEFEAQSGTSLTLDYDFNFNGWSFELDGTLQRVGKYKSYSNCNKWIHLVGVWSPVNATDFGLSVFRLYINGSEVGSQDHNFGHPAPMPLNPIGAMMIGRHQLWGSYFKGEIDDLRIFNRPISGIEVAALHNGYYNTCCINWTSTPPVLDPESAEAIDYLCNKQIIQTNQQPSAITSSIRKDELAKILFRGLYEPDTLAATPVDYAPNPFIDLQPSVSAYSREAKVLSYLQYDDGISVFKRELSHFRPQFAIQRKYVVKAMLETFNIKPYTATNAPTPACWYSDVAYGSEMYFYILKAREMGFIKQQTSFSPNAEITRKEAFLILYRILKYFETTPKPAPALSDYFIASNIDPCNFGRSLGISDANFNAYTKTSFAIAGLMPLTFAHTYNSAYTELPDSSYNIIEPLGKGWTHNYNCYLQRVADDLDSNIRYVITWGDGTMNSFRGNGAAFVPECNGLYATLTADAGQNSFTYKTKSQVSYVFTRYVLSNRTVHVLTSVKDRNNNTLTLTWTPFPVVAVPSQIRLFKVEDAGGRYLQFSYENDEPSKIKTVTAVTGSITRSIGFAYENNFSDLKAYINLKGDSTVYFYEDSLDLTKNHLLKQIKLPKGNIVDNTYEQRKLKSTQMAGQYQTNVNTQFNYTAGNNTNFTESQIATTRNGNTLSSTIKQDQRGNVKNAVSPTGNLSLSYDDPLHGTKPTDFNNTINSLSASTKYDAMGNVTSVTKTGGGINLKDSFTYNGFNDILTYINARGNKTEFTYNATGNLTKITDALDFETNLQVNSNGTVSKVTNPESIYTDFMYDAFGNTTQSKLMNTITANAQYDGASRLVGKTDPNGTVSTIEYDINDLVKKVIVDPTGLNNTVSYHYDKNDNLDTIINPKGGKTSLSYNSYDQMVEYRFGSFAKTYTYNEDGTLNTFTNQNGTAFTHNYNADGTLQSDGYASYGYDAEFNLQNITSAVNNKVIQFGYDALKRTNSISYNDYPGNTVQYDYDNNSNVTAITYPGGFKVGYEYDALDRLIRVYNFATNNNYAQYTYYKDGRLKDQVNGNGTKTVYRYDVYGRLDSIGNHTSTNSNIASYKFAMDNLGNHVGETNYEPVLPVIPPLQSEAIAYAHDDMNRMNNRGSTAFTYDGNGNNTSATGEWNSNFTFDIKDNLLTSTSPTLVCEYDALENRRRKNDTLYVLDILGGSNVLMETDVNGNPYSYYIHGLGLICRLDATQTNTAYYHYDYRGSTTAITSSSQNITHSYRYGAFGEIVQSSETGFKNPYRYVGKYGVQYEGDSMYFMRARYYNAVKGRFLGEDPVWSTNLLAYAHNNPINFQDIDGRWPTWVKKAAKVIGVAGEAAWDWAKTKQDIALQWTAEKLANTIGADIAIEYCQALKEGIESGFGIKLAAEANEYYEEKYIASVKNGKSNDWYLIGYLITSNWSSLENAKQLLETLSFKLDIEPSEVAKHLKAAFGSAKSIITNGETFYNVWNLFKGVSNTISSLEDFNTLYLKVGEIADTIINLTNKE